MLDTSKLTDDEISVLNIGLCNSNFVIPTHVECSKLLLDNLSAEYRRRHRT